jgi:hypothetical protein
MSQSPVSAGIRRWCQALRLGIAVFITGLLALYIALWVWPEIRLGTNPGHVILQSAVSLQELPLADRLLLAAVGLPYLLALGYALYRLDQLLRGFMRGEFFDIASVGHLRAFSGYLLLAKALALLTMHVRAYLMHYMPGYDKQKFAIHLSNDDVAVLLMCALFFVIARMMEEGRRLAEENREFI